MNRRIKLMARSGLRRKYSDTWIRIGVEYWWLDRGAPPKPSPSDLDNGIGLDADFGESHVLGLSNYGIESRNL